MSEPERKFTFMGKGPFTLGETPLTSENCDLLGHEAKIARAVGRLVKARSEWLKIELAKLQSEGLQRDDILLQEFSDGRLVLCVRGQPRSEWKHSLIVNGNDIAEAE